MILRTAFALPLLGVLLGCSTPEFQAEQAICQAEWERRIPVKLERQLVERVRYIRVPTGVSTCTTSNGVQTCVSQMRSEAIPYTAVETVDVNAPARTPQIRACTAQACVARFGNPDCKPAGS